MRSTKMAEVMSHRDATQRPCASENIKELAQAKDGMPPNPSLDKLPSHIVHVGDLGRAGG